MTTYVTENHKLDDVRGLLDRFIKESVHANHSVRDDNVATIVQHPDILTVVAYREDTPVGLLMATEWCHPLFSGKLVSDMLVYVVPEHRGSMLGSRFVKVIERWAQVRQADRIMLGQSTGIGDINRVIKFYEKLGYTATGFNCTKEL